ncbi:MAG TPA: DNA mismatch repair endonuclease MutL [Candidatus Acidoferrum sp.]|jgi:DNA mismatch repair protein MutL|nr:DNA mismatch repair endonuclease MutL [Candidatus Acidoferrum sp.]
MNRIRLLPEQVANQIAAGEVVERPASVVKELVENALDAQAARITLEIQAGGRSLMRVIDDGFGMSRDDALLCLERHATSKIRRAEDLAAIATMGFRGEALPSIASVSRFTLTTRERDSGSPEGTQVIISGGKMLEVKAAGCAPGTTIEVRQLFFNLPARRKFLRTEETESSHIQHYLTLAALAFPEVAFSFQKDGRLVWQLAAVKTGAAPASRSAALRERLRALYGNEQRLVAVDFSADLTSPQDAEDADSGGFDSASPTPATPDSADRAPNFRVWGFIGAPGVARATREDQHLFVNRRPVENRGLNYALLEGYHTALMKGRYPVCCLFLEVDPAAVDVNIHPAKREVKFHREAEVRRFVAQAVRQALLEFHAGDSQVSSPKSQVHGPPTTDHGPQSEALVGGRTEQTSLPNLPAALKPPPAESPTRPAAQPPLRMGFRPAAPAAPPASETQLAPLPGLTQSTPAAPPSDANLAPVTPMPADPGLTQHAARFAPLPLLSVPLRLVGVIGRLYVVFESDRGLVLLDQHAAHERILFEQMLDRLERNEQAPSQKLLLPETVELSARDANFVREQLPVLARLGVGLSEFGERTFLLDALPPFVRAADPRRFVLELVDELKGTGQEVNSLRLGEHTVAKTVCRHAVKANDPLAGRELENLVEDLRRCAMPYTCPHGRPTLIEMNFRELEKKFGRSV